MLQPMFVMINDGGNLENQDQASAQRVLIQRAFLFDLLSFGTAVTLFNGVEFRDSKVSRISYAGFNNRSCLYQILSFVHEYRFNPKARALLPSVFWNAVGQARTSLDGNELQVASRPGKVTQSDRKDPPLVQLGRRVLLECGDSHSELLYLFIVHCLMLPRLSVQDRSRFLDALHPGLVNILVKEFLPQVFFAFTEIITTNPLSPLDIDGRVFVSLVHFLLLNRSKPFREIVGDSTCTIAEDIWLQIGGSPRNFPSFASRFPLPSSTSSSNSQITKSEGKVLPLLSFDNAVFNQDFSYVQVPVSTQDDALSTAPANRNGGGKFGLGTLFNDTQHWHNNKPLIALGSSVKPLNWRQLRSVQRFTKNLQAQAATLTGALGASLQQMAIAPVGDLKKATTIYFLSLWGLMHYVN